MTVATPIKAEQQRASGFEEFVFAAGARNDRWRDLKTFAQIWAGNHGGLVTAHKEVVRLYREIEPVENYWAYPGPILMRALKDLLDAKDAGGFARLANKIGRSMMSGAYRHDPAAWDPVQESAVRHTDAL